MKKARIPSLTILAVGIIALFGPAAAVNPKSPVRVALVLNRTSGDKSFSYFAARGIQAAEQRPPVQGRIVYCMTCKQHEVSYLAGHVTVSNMLRPK